MISSSTTTSILILIIVYTYTNHSKYNVNAQLYVRCNTDSSSGTLLETCYVNRASPLTYTAAYGTPIILGSVSSLAVRCSSSVPGTVDTCKCAIAIDPVDAIKDDVCTSCNITTINDTVFENYFDCSNQLIGSCVGLTATGECINNIAAPTPFLDPISTSLAPLPTPFPVITPTMNSPIILPVVLPSSDQGESSSNLKIGIVIAIGVIGGIVLSILVAYCMTWNKRQPTRKITKPMDKSLVPTVTTGSREYSTSNVDNTDTSTQSPAIGVRNPTPSGNNNVYQPNHRTLTIPEIPRSYKATISSAPQPLKSASTMAIQPRPSYPVNPNLHFKDQCRGVAPVVTAVLSSPVAIFVSREHSTKALPFAVAVDASTVSSMPSIPVSTSEKRNNHKTRDRMLLDA